MADFFKGLSGGFQTGLQLSEKLRQRRMEDELAQAYAKPEEFTDYTPEQLKQIQGLQAAGGYDVQAVPGAEGAAPTLRYTAKPGSMYYDDMGQPEAPIDVAPQRVQRYGGQTVAGQFNPEQLRGLQMREAARVMGSYGDVRGAAALEAQAAEQEYQAKYRPLQLEQTQGQISAQKQQSQLTGLEINQRTRTEAEALNASNFAAFAAENPKLTTAELKDAAFAQFKFTPKQWQETVNTRLGIKDNEQKDFVLNIKDKLKGKNLQQLGSLYNTDSDFDDKTDLAIVPGKNGAVTLNFIDKATGKVTSTEQFKSQALATEYLNKQATEPETIGTWMLSLREKEANISQKEASTAKDLAQAGLANRQGRDDKLTPLEKNIAALGRLGIRLSPEDVKSIVGVKSPGLSKEAEAQIELITASIKENPSPANIEAASQRITSIFRQEELSKRNITIASGLRTAARANDIPTAIEQLRGSGVSDETIASIAKQAGVALPSDFTVRAPAPATPAAPAAPATGLQLPSVTKSDYVPPPTSPAGRVMAARAAADAAAAESKQGLSREVSRAQSALAEAFTADARTLSPVELIRKYDSMRGQLPREQAAMLFSVERNLR